MDAYVPSEPIDRELRRRQLAQRLVTHHARTQTIYRFTGLSRHQLATLRERWRIPKEMRHRGPAPNSYAAFLAPGQAREEAAALGVFWRVLARVEATKAQATSMSMVEAGEDMCHVLEAYLACFPKSTLELEHLVLLTRGIEESDAIALGKCGNCQAMTLVDLLGTRRRLCSHCQPILTASVVDSDSHENTEPSQVPSGNHEAVQQELF